MQSLTKFFFHLSAAERVGRLKRRRGWAGNHQHPPGCLLDSADHDLTIEAKFKELRKNNLINSPILLG